MHARALGAGDQPGSCPRPLGPGRPSRDGSNRGSPHLSQINGRKGHPSVRSQVSPHGSVPGLGVGKTRRTRSRRSTKPRPPRAPRVALPQTERAAARTTERTRSCSHPGVSGGLSHSRPARCWPARDGARAPGARRSSAGVLVCERPGSACARAGGACCAAARCAATPTPARGWGGMAVMHKARYARAPSSMLA